MSIAEQFRTEPAPIRKGQTDQRFVLYDISWQFYRAFLKELADRPIRLTYDRGTLELMAPSFRHESLSAILGRFIEILTMELNIPIRSGKSTTFSRQDLNRGLEPDECYYIGNELRVRGKLEIDLKRDPPPDLAIEIDITSSSTNRMGIYAALGVPEVWRFDGENLRICRLRPDGKYEESSQSLCFPFLPWKEFVSFLEQIPETDETSLARSFQSWVREKILPGWKGAGDGTGSSPGS
jgi:Uma2 family endonuclease